MALMSHWAPLLVEKTDLLDLTWIDHSELHFDRTKEKTMPNILGRRDFLKASALLAGAAAAGGLGRVDIASAAPIEVPTIDKLSIRVLVDQQHDQFLRGSTVNGVVH